MDDLDLNNLTALTLWPEWAWAIDLPGHRAKRVENRSWAPPSRLVGSDAPWIALHAGAHIGGRAAAVATWEGLEGVREMARHAGLNVHLDYDMKTRGCWSIRVRDGDEGPVFARGPTYDGDPVGPDAVEKPIVTRAVIGLFRVTELVRPDRGLTRPGVAGWKVPEAWGWVFDYVPLTEPVPCQGAQGLWIVGADTVAQVRERVAG